MNSYNFFASTAATRKTTKSLSHDEPGVRHSFGVEASLPLMQGIPTMTYDNCTLFYFFMTV